MSNEEQEEKEIDPDIYIQAINEGATQQEAYELATIEGEE
jgi:hypothetical protein